ncbi:quinolinate synthase NadA [Bacteroides acidifaciens]|uniref:quinolinate synthase NadA n=1 Tax=Bacteroides acidifaciens TaxID=85831 RepID=UPI003F690017
MAFTLWGNGKGALSGQKVLVPDMAAGCSLADSCPADQFLRSLSKSTRDTPLFVSQQTAAVKAGQMCGDFHQCEADRGKLPQTDEKIIFGPDRNLGNYINSVTNRNMLLWTDCHVHEQFSVEKIVELKRSIPKNWSLAHPNVRVGFEAGGCGRI